MKKFSFIILAIFFWEFVLYSYVDIGRIRVDVAEFIDRSDKLYSASAFMRKVTDTFTKILAQSSNNIDVTNSKSFQALNGVRVENFADAGKSSGCQYVVLGALMRKDIDTPHS